MSASREKQRRQDLRNSPDYKPPKQNTGLSKRSKVLIKIAVVVVLLAIVGWGVLNSGLLFPYLPAVNVQGESISVAEYNLYLYNTARQEISVMTSMYGELVTGMPDFSRPLNRQSSGMGGTWAEYFQDSAMQTVSTAVELSRRATAAGLTLDAADLESIDQSVASLRETAAANNTSTGRLLSANYGQGVTLAVFRKAMERGALAEKYRLQYNEGLDTSDAALEAYYDTHSSDFDEISFRSFEFTLPAAETPTEELDQATIDANAAAALADAKAKAEEMARRIREGEAFNAVAKDNAPADDTRDYDDPNTSLARGMTKSQILAPMNDWLFDPQRQNGDVGVLEVQSSDGASTTSVLVLQAVGRARGDYAMQSVRHLLVNWKLPEDAAADQTPNDGEKEMTRLQAESYLNEYLSGEQTEENFATLATRVSEDTGSQSTGGLYENIYKGQMVLPFEEWCFDPARKAGDTGLVETTYGYHVMYYVGPGETRWKNQVKTTLETEHSTALTTDLDTNVTSSPNAFGLFFSGGM